MTVMSNVSCVCEQSVELQWSEQQRGAAAWQPLRAVRQSPLLLLLLLCDDDDDDADRVDTASQYRNFN